MRRRHAALCTLAVTALCACGSTTDSLGSNGAGGADPGATLRPLSGPASYPNALRDVLGKTDAEISARIAAAFQQLFHGDPATEAILVPIGDDQAFIFDVLHGDVRTEGIGYAMIIAVELDKRTEFDQLWTYAHTALQYKTGARSGYFRSSCDTRTGTTPCLDPFGLEQFVTALLFANDRWGRAGSIDYAADALELFGVMRNKEAENGGVVDGVTNTFDAATQLVFDEPDSSASGFTRPSIEMPAYYELWAQATGDSFYADAAQAARGHWKAAANATTGLMPVRANFDGTPTTGWENFEAEGYRTQINLALDQIWFGKEPWEIDNANKLIAFFAQQGIDTYGRSYSLDGTVCLDCAHDLSLVVTNGATALISGADQRAAFIQEAWDVALPTGPLRYYTGLLDLLSLLILSGQYRVY